MGELRVSDGSTFRRVYLLRHGETLYQPGDHSGEELTERGYEQFEPLARMFAARSLDGVYSILQPDRPLSGDGAHHRSAERPADPDGRGIARDPLGDPAGR